MEDILFCEHLAKCSEQSPVKPKQLFECFIIIQTMSDSGLIVVGDQVYPMTVGGLYFIDGADKHEIMPTNKTDYVQSHIYISRGFMKSLAKTLDFSNLLQAIFSDNGGYYLPLKNYKTVNRRMKRICSNVKSTKDYAKALVASDLLALLNYAVYNIKK
jgi:hypothetical protein